VEQVAVGGVDRGDARVRLPDSDGGPSRIASGRPVADPAVERDRINGMTAGLIRSRDVLDKVIEAASVAAE
jgi:hypothetical protein